ncbi:MAG: DUF58 domain-containing protein, partial [Pseudomonadota bacterium]
ATVSRNTASGGSADRTGAHNAFLGEQGEAQSVAALLPSLLIEASRVASTVVHGVHGRRRAGPGETFWQFRTYDQNDDATLIDWRRSASSDHVFVREREWEAAHTVWLWPDLSPSMTFHSHLSRTAKRSRALVLTLAMAEILVKAGERVGILGLMRPTGNRNAAERLAETVAQHADDDTLASGLPPRHRPGRFSGLLLVSDFLEPIDQLEPRLAELASGGVAGHMVQVLDPAEEVLPYAGRAEFVGMSNEIRWTAERAETLREAYLAKLAEHRDRLREIARKSGWTFTVHHTDRAATEPLLALIMRLQAGDAFGAAGGAGIGAVGGGSAA